MFRKKEKKSAGFLEAKQMKEGNTIKLVFPNGSYLVVEVLKANEIKADVYGDIKIKE